MIQYRREIDGLRALAVLPVMLFHAGIGPFSGGFVGVDVFFVISGYLITGFVASDLDEGAFSIARFYERRARRILPALLLVVFASIPLASMWLLPWDRDEFARSAAAVAAFASNFFFWAESGYFDAAGEGKPLLHTWSLGVEEQFYLLFPLILMAAWRLGRARLVAALAVMGAASLALAQWQSTHAPSAAFYLLPARGWELIAGALVSLFLFRRPLAARRWMAQTGSAAGLASIVLSLFILDRHTPHPSVWTLLPVVGTALVILFATPETWAGRVLSARILVGIGLASYSIYLWHQPLLAFARHASAQPLSPAVSAALCALSVFLGALTWRFVERPFRHGTLVSRRQVAAFGLAGSAVLASYGAISTLAPTGAPAADDAMGDIAELLAIGDTYQHFGLARGMRTGVCHSVAVSALANNGCLDARRRNIQLWGDSYAAALFPGLDQVRSLRHREWGILQTTDSNGPPFYTDHRTDDGKTLAEANDSRMAIARRYQPEVIVIAWMIGGVNAQDSKADTLRQLDETLGRIRSASPRSRVVVVGPFPHWSGSLLRQMVNYRRETGRLPPEYMASGLVARYRDWDRDLAAHVPRPGVTYVSSQAALCNEQGCLTRTSDQLADLTAVDWGHLSRNASIYFIQQIEGRIFR